MWKIPAVECHWHQVTLSQYHKPLDEHTQKLSRKITKNAKLNSPTLTYRFQKHTQMSTWIRFQTRPVPNVVKITHYTLGLYPGVASSLVSRGFLGTLPGDSSWKTEEGSFHSRHLEGLTGEARPVSGHWSVVSIRWLCSEPTCPEYSPVFTTRVILTAIYRKPLVIISVKWIFRILVI